MKKTEFENEYENEWGSYDEFDDRRRKVRVEKENYRRRKEIWDEEDY